MKAIVTLCLGADQLGELTHPLMRDYADRVGADFVVIDTPKLNLKYIHYEKYQVYELLNTYDRILFLDSDIIVTPNCPDLFEIVPANQFGAFLVSKHSYFHDGAIGGIQEVLGDIGWKREYFNSGVMLVSKQHQEVFCPEGDLLLWESEKRDFFDQTILNYTVKKLGVPIYDIGYKFNHTTDPKNSRERWGRKVSQVLNFSNNLIGAVKSDYKQHLEKSQNEAKYIVHYHGKEIIQHRFKSYMIHYTGKGHRRNGNKVEQIRQDLALMSRKNVIHIPLIDRFI